MKKKNLKKSNRVGKEVNETKAAQELIERGDHFGQTVIGIMAQFAYDRKCIGIAAIGLAKAVAALKFVAKEMGCNIDGIFNSELAYYEEKYDQNGV